LSDECGFDTYFVRDVETIADYDDQWLAGRVSNQPVRMDGDTLAREIGQSAFQHRERSVERN
jgi:hypothetical protein